MSDKTLLSTCSIVNFFKEGSGVNIHSITTNLAGVHYDPEDVRIDIYDPNGKQVVSNAPVEHVSLGNYCYPFKFDKRYKNQTCRTRKKWKAIIRFEDIT
jgi:hypothetical protein